MRNTGQKDDTYCQFHNSQCSFPDTFHIPTNSKHGHHLFIGGGSFVFLSTKSKHEFCEIKNWTLVMLCQILYTVEPQYQNFTLNYCFLTIGAGPQKMLTVKC